MIPSPADSSLPDDIERERERLPPAAVSSSIFEMSLPLLVKLTRLPSFLSILARKPDLSKCLTSPESENSALNEFSSANTRSFPA